MQASVGLFCESHSSAVPLFSFNQMRCVCVCVRTLYFLSLARFGTPLELPIEFPPNGHSHAAELSRMTYAFLSLSTCDAHPLRRAYRCSDCLCLRPSSVSPLLNCQRVRACVRVYVGNGASPVSHSLVSRIVCVCACVLSSVSLVVSSSNKNEREREGCHE